VANSCWRRWMLPRMFRVGAPAIRWCVPSAGGRGTEEITINFYLNGFRREEVRNGLFLFAETSP
jgi:hypothetical protein